MKEGVPAPRGSVGYPPPVSSWPGKSVFHLVTGLSSWPEDQPEAVAQLVEGVEQGIEHQVLLGPSRATGKTFTVANRDCAAAEAGADPRAQQDAGRPALQTSSSCCFPTTAVRLLRQRTTTTTSRKPTFPRPTPTSRRNSSINDEIDKPAPLGDRRAARNARTSVIVASVSCIYGLRPRRKSTSTCCCFLEEGMRIDRDEVARPPRGHPVPAQSDVASHRGTFRVPRRRRGDLPGLRGCARGGHSSSSTTRSRRSRRSTRCAAP